LVLTIISTAIAATMAKPVEGGAYGSIAIPLAGGIALAVVVATLGHVWASDNGAEPNFRMPAGDPDPFGGQWHGFSGPWRGGYFTSLEGSNQAACLVPWPGHVPARKVSNELVHLVDDVLDDPVEGVQERRARGAREVSVGSAEEHHVVGEEGDLPSSNSCREPHRPGGPSRPLPSKR
jgi:hypothetical protein